MSIKMVALLVSLMSIKQTCYIPIELNICDRNSHHTSHIVVYKAVWLPSTQEVCVGRGEDVKASLVYM